MTAIRHLYSLALLSALVASVGCSADTGEATPGANPDPSEETATVADGLNSGSGDFAFQSPAGTLWTVIKGVPKNWTTAPRMAPDASPSADYASVRDLFPPNTLRSGHCIAYRSASGHLAVAGFRETTPFAYETPLVVAAKTTPEVRSGGDACLVVFHDASTGALTRYYEFDMSYGIYVVRSPYKMAPGTSAGQGPTTLYFHGIDNFLYGYDLGNGVTTKVAGTPPMRAGASPRVVRLSNGSAEVAYVSAGGALVTTGSAGTRNWGYAVHAGTDPSIGAFGTGFVAAFQAADGALWSAGTPGFRNWGAGMVIGTSPAAPLGAPFQIGIHANTGTLFIKGAGLTVAKMAPGTSPARF